MQLICALLKTRVIFAPVAKQNLHEALLQVAFAVWQVKKSIDAEPIEEGSMPPLSAVIWAGSALNVKHLQQLQEAIAEEAASLHRNDYPRDFIERATAAAIASSASTAPAPVPPAKPASVEGEKRGEASKASESKIKTNAKGKNKATDPGDQSSNKRKSNNELDRSPSKRTRAQEAAERAQ